MKIRGKTVYVYDIEVFPNVFHCTAKNTESGKFHKFEISSRKNQLSELVDFFRVPNVNIPLKFGDLYTTETQIDSNKIFAGYNNLHYDNPIINYIIDYYNILKNKPYLRICDSIFNLSRTITTSQADDNIEAWKKWKYQVWYDSFDILTMLYSQKLRVGLKEMQVTMQYPNVLEFDGDFNKFLEEDRIEEMIGFEGQAAKYYFKGLSACIDENFTFQGRNRRPPRDEFNSMISLGYSILMNEVYCKVEMKGLNPYFGFIHRDAEKHPTLASDMIEEWRAIIVDATAMSMINGHEILKDHFYFNMDEPGCYITKDGLKLYLNKLERKFQTEVRYLKYVDYAVSFRRGIFLQMEHLAKAIEEGDASLYEPIIIR